MESQIAVVPFSILPEMFYSFLMPMLDNFAIFRVCIFLFPLAMNSILGHVEPLFWFLGMLVKNFRIWALKSSSWYLKTVADSLCMSSTSFSSIVQEAATTACAAFPAQYWNTFSRSHSCHISMYIMYLQLCYL